MAYLEAAFEEGDPSLVAAVLGDIARAKGTAQIARDTGLSRERLYKALSSKDNPEFATIIKVVSARVSGCMRRRCDVLLSADSFLAFRSEQSNCAYDMAVRVTFDPAKNERNVRERNLSFESVAEFDFDNALVQTDSRQEYGETRYVALGNLRGRLHVLRFTETPDGIRVISFRKANDREVRNYAEVQTTD